MRVTDGWSARWPDSDVVSVRTDHYGKPAYEALADPDVADVGPVAHERSDGIGPDARRGG